MDNFLIGAAAYLVVFCFVSLLLFVVSVVTQNDIVDRSIIDRMAEGAFKTLFFAINFVLIVAVLFTSYELLTWALGVITNG